MGLNFYSDWLLCPETTDSDGDGLADELEELYAPGDLTVLSAAADTDGDGLTDGEEADLGTDPTSADTDFDGMADGADTNPLLPDNLVFQLAGDCNGDGAQNVSDVTCAIAVLFPGFNLLSREPPTLTCADDADNAAVLDVNGDGVADLSDVIYQANFLFNAGPGPVQGNRCFPFIPSAGCESKCGV